MNITFSLSLAANATYLNRVIQQRFGRGFKDLLNAKRVAGVAANIHLPWWTTGAIP